MSKYEELEVKILNIDKEEIKKKLDGLGAIYKEENVQKIYTYDCYDIDLMYKLALNDYKETKSFNSLSKIKRVLEYIKPVVTKEDKEIIKRVTNYEEISDYIDNNMGNIDVSVLEDEKVLEIIKSFRSRFFKWIRLRQTGDKTHLTIKYIYNTNSLYEMDQVKEIEIEVNSFEVANLLVEEMGYFRKKLVEKKRCSYTFNDCSIEIDEWPLINPYIEIEGQSSEKIYETVEKLGYQKSDALVMNTEDVYLLEGKDLTSYEVLTFKESKKQGDMKCLGMKSI